jgi:hypothetical protein
MLLYSFIMNQPSASHLIHAHILLNILLSIYLLIMSNCLYVILSMFIFLVIVPVYLFLHYTLFYHDCLCSFYMFTIGLFIVYMLAFMVKKGETYFKICSFKLICTTRYYIHVFDKFDMSPNFLSIHAWLNNFCIYIMLKVNCWPTIVDLIHVRLGLNFDNLINDNVSSLCSYMYVLQLW